MTMVKMKAPNDPGFNLHISSVGPDPIAPGATFEVSEEVAKDLEKRELATRAKAEKAAPENKMEAAPENKAADKPPISAKSVPSKNTATAKRKAK